MPGTTPVIPGNLPTPIQVPNSDTFTYDGLGRVVRDDSKQNGLTRSYTKTFYNGDRTTVIPPTGGVATTTITDPLGRKTELDQYTTDPTLHEAANAFTGIGWVNGGSPTITGYGYDGHHNQNTVTDAQNHTWTSTYTLLGRVEQKDDPDTGQSSLAYDAAGNLIQSSDSRGKTLSYTYDALNRKTAQYTAPVAGQTPANETASWVYDNANNAVPGMTNPIGRVTTETAYHGGAAYINQATGFDAFGNPLGQTITIPSATEGTALGTSYTFNHTFHATTGIPISDTYPLGGGLAREVVQHTYTGGVYDLPTGIGGPYAQKTQYDAYARPTTETIGTGTNLAYLTYQYDDHTGRLNQQTLTRSSDTAPTAFTDRQSYQYDLAGNVTRQTSSRNSSTTPSETQCFSYDRLDRLTQAWTATDTCTATPTTAAHDTVGDPLAAVSAYWSTWDLDLLGNRTSQVQHGITGSPVSVDTTTTYHYDNTTQPHTLTGTSSTGGTTQTTAYGYNPAGDMNSRTTPATGTQSLNWDDTGALASVTGTTGTSTFVYDADGALLLQKDPGTTTLYLPGEQLTLNTATQTVNGVRYIQLPAGGTAVRTGTGTNYRFELSDPHGTPTLYLDNTAQTPTWRQTTPYGEPRGTAPTNLPDNRGFLNKPTDTSTGLTRIGARNYDPTIGRFISVDPLQDLTDPQQWNGYAYANNNPTTLSDPTGTCIPRDDNHGCIPGTLGSAPHRGSTSNNSGRGGTATGSGGGSTANSGADKDSAAKRYVKSLGNSLWGFVKDTGSMAKDSAMCSGLWVDPGACRRQLDRGIGTLRFANDIAGCLLANMNDGCGHLEKDFDCQNGASAECLGNLTALGIEIAVAHKAADVAGLGDTAAAGCSFAPATQVVMADGTAKRIDDIKPGDSVKATDPSDGRSANKPVIALHDDLDTDMADVTIADARGHRSVIQTTQNHPFWDATTHQWTRADQLRRGDHLSSTTNAIVNVVQVHSYTQLNHRLNLTVDTLHTYYVLAGTTPVLVHNVNPACEVSVSKSKYPESAQHIEDAQAAGQPAQLTIDRGGARARRAESMRGNARVSGMDRDEYPPAMFEEGGTGSSVRPIGQSDNRGAGSSIGHQCRGLPNGTVVTVTVCG
jgi:RHS repeat-associated protein